jgi:hypothetical protein
MTKEEVERRRCELTSQLYAVGFRHPMPTAEGISAHNTLLAEIQRQLAELPELQPETIGEAAGTVRIGPAPLGDPWTPPPREPDARELARGDDPFFRFAGEQGWQNK